MISATALRDRLTAIGRLPDPEVDPAEAALLLAACERPGQAVEPYLRHVDRLGSDVAAYAARRTGAPDLDLRCEALHQVLARRYGYLGAEDPYDDPDGGNLMRVIDHRRGVPVALGILYIAAARRAGWTVEGVDFPVRFLVRLIFEGERAILDPLEGGRRLEPPELRELYKAAAGLDAELAPSAFEPLDNHGTVLRLQYRHKALMLRAGRMDLALAVIDRTLLVAPDEVGLWREKGLIYARLDDVPAAVAALEEYLRRCPADPAQDRTERLLRDLRARLS